MPAQRPRAAAAWRDGLSEDCQRTVRGLTGPLKCCNQARKPDESCSAVVAPLPFGKAVPRVTLTPHGSQRHSVYLREVYQHTARSPPERTGSAIETMQCCALKCSQDGWKDAPPDKQPPSI